LLNLDYYGHSCFSLTDEKYFVLIDPFISGNPTATVQAKDLNPTHILVSHGHQDHLGDAIDISKRTGALIIAPNELALYCQSKGAKAHPMHIGGSYGFDFGRVKLTNALHGSAVGSGDNIVYTGNPCGFLVWIADKLVYHAGDTGISMDMKLLGEMYDLDCALLPIGDNYVMGPDDAVAAALMLKPKLTIPMHYNTFPLIAQDPEKFIEKLTAAGMAGKIMRPGERHVL